MPITSTPMPITSTQMPITSTQMPITSTQMPHAHRSPLLKACMSVRYSLNLGAGLLIERRALALANAERAT
eukprot:6103791-Pyramimonas_sp.AAC.1